VENLLGNALPMSNETAKGATSMQTRLGCLFAAGLVLTASAITLARLSTSFAPGLSKTQIMLRRVGVV
jgi:hypothetical protein